ncbi:MAG: hypothetical protein ABFS23_07175 [Pseudomonadota bacterium]
MIRVDPAAWRGLPEASVQDFDAIFGPPIERETADLGSYPAVRHLYRADDGTGLVLWSRDKHAVMVEALRAPPLSVLDELPAPSAVLPREIRVPDAYAHEYLYCPIGLILTVTVPLEPAGKEAPSGIVRCRGIKPLARVEDFGPAYYLPLEDRIRWSAAVGGH